MTKPKGILQSLLDYEKTHPRITTKYTRELIKKALNPMTPTNEERVLYAAVQHLHYGGFKPQEIIELLPCKPPLTAKQIQTIANGPDYREVKETKLIKSLILGTAVDIDETMEVTRERLIPIRIVINAPCAGFGIIDRLRLGNGFDIGQGVLSSDICPFGPENMYTYSAGAQGVRLELPTLKKGDPITIKGKYTGLIPQGFTRSNRYDLVITLIEPSFIPRNIPC